MLKLSNTKILVSLFGMLVVKLRLENYGVIVSYFYIILTNKNIIYI